jgi:hypothetical protein
MLFNGLKNRTKEASLQPCNVLCDFSTNRTETSAKHQKKCFYSTLNGYDSKDLFFTPKWLIFLMGENETRGKGILKRDSFFILPYFVGIMKKGNHQTKRRSEQ